MKRLLACCLMLTLWLATSAPAKEVGAKAYLSIDKLAPGQPFKVAVVVTIEKPWHINANPAGADLVPTTLEFKLPATLAIDKVAYPTGHAIAVSWADQPVPLYSETVTIIATGQVRKDAAPGPAKITGLLGYQACNDKTCLAPVDIPVVLETVIAAPGTKPAPQHPEIFGAPPPAGKPAGPPPGKSAGGESNSIDTLIRDRGWIIALVVVFFGGLALNLTPCVYPMIAITVGYFGGQGDRKTSVAFSNSLIYFLGIVTMYSSLGLVAALTGGLFGALLQSVWVLIGIAVLLVALALSMFGLFEIQPPQFLMQKATGLSSKAGYLGVFFLGAMVGIIAAPCLAPILVALLVYVGQRGDAWAGWWLFFTLACGLGLPYILLGTFSGLLARLPKSGTWMNWVKRVFGTALILVAGWILSPLFEKKETSLIAWQPYSQATVTQAAGQPVLIDFWAEWCGPCRKMEKTTFRDARVVAKAKTFAMLKADLTREGTPAVEALRQKFAIRGVPTTVFLDPTGTEHTNLRRVEYVDADELLKLMDQAVQPAPVPTGSAPTPDLPAEVLPAF